MVTLFAEKLLKDEGEFTGNTGAGDEKLNVLEMDIELDATVF